MGILTGRRRALVAATAVVGACLASAAGALGQALDPVLGPQALIGRPAPELDVHALPGGDRVRLADERGRVVLLVLFSRWCSECRLSTTRLDRLQQRHRDWLRIIAVTEDGRDGARAFAQQNPVELTVAWDDGRTRRSYGARRLPTFVLIDRSGFVRRVFVGADAETLASLEDAVQGFAR